MKALKWIVIVLVGLLGLLFGIGAALPNKFTVTRSIFVNATPDAVYSLIDNPRRWRDWAVWNQRDPAMRVTYSGAQSGGGAVWTWKSNTQGDGRMTFTAAEPGRSLNYDVYVPDFGTTSTGVLLLVARGQGTTVTWVMNGDVGGNPLLRWRAPLADSMVGKDFEASLTALKALAERS